MKIPTEPIGSIPRPLQLIEAIAAAGDFADPRLDPLYEEAIRDTITQFEATGSPIITDGEQRKYHNFWTYSVHGLQNTAPDGFKIPFSAGHVRRMPRLTAGPFRYRVYADRYLDMAKSFASKAPETGRHFALRPQPDVPGRRHSRLLAPGIHRRLAARARNGDSPLFREGCAESANRFHRRAVGGEARSF